AAAPAADPWKELETKNDETEKKSSTVLVAVGFVSGLARRASEEQVPANKNMQLPNRMPVKAASKHSPHALDGLGRALLDYWTVLLLQLLETGWTVLLLKVAVEFGYNATTGCQGEGYRGSTTTIQAAGCESTFIDHFAKGGQPLPEDYGPRQRTPSYTAVQKRSFKRACKRALRYGSTMYHGIIYTPADFPSQLLDKMQRPACNIKEKINPMPQHRKAARLRLLCWNSGGMSQGKLLELRLVGGILIMIAKSLISAEHIGYDAVEPIDMWWRLQLCYSRNAPMDRHESLTILALRLHLPYWPVMFPIYGDGYKGHDKSCRCGAWSSYTGVLARGAQITHQIASPTPCVLCQKPYKRNHSCPVATQVACLQLHGQDSNANPDALRTCIICDLLLPDMAQLHQHLGRCHDLQIPDWCPARDSLEGSSACAHCGATFETQSGLRRHILDGRCERFNPAASPQPLDAATKWTEVLQQGELTRSTLTPAQRQDLFILPQIAPLCIKLRNFCFHSMDETMPDLDPNDMELLASFRELGPLLQAASRYQRDLEEEPHSKRPKQEVGHEEAKPVAVQPQVQGAMMGMMKVMARLLLQHERSIQLLHRQDSFVFYAQVSPQGAVPLLTQAAVEWKDLHQKNPGSLKVPTLRTHLMKTLTKEIHRRVQQMSNSSKGTELWDRAVDRGVLLPDGSWPYQRWSHTDHRLIPAARPPLPMARLLKQLQHMEELLEDSTHVIRFQSLKAQPTVIPWYLQICMRTDEIWLILTELQQLAMWSLLGLTLKAHQQGQCKQAQLLQQCLQQNPSNAKGKGKGKAPGKHKNR
ncbi:unnamed protein product, partial [Cladocopium goreaui]